MFQLLHFSALGLRLLGKLGFLFLMVMAWLMALTLIRFHVRPYKATAIATMTAVLAGGPLSFCVIRSGSGYGSLATIKGGSIPDKKTCRPSDQVRPDICI